MATVLTPNAKEQTIATTTKNQIRIKTPKRNKRGSNNNISNPSQNFDTYAGLLNLPQQKQPPLLPLPHVSAILHHNKPLLPRNLNTQSLSLTPKKSKPKKREETKKRSGTQYSTTDFLMDNPWGPDPKNLPVVIGIGNMDVFSESVFNLAPPPSSLPLPKFSLRSKLSCNTEAVDDGATNNLRRLLRLR